MADSIDERRKRFDELAAGVIRPARWPATHEVEISAHHVHGEPVPYAVAVAQAFEPFRVGDRWGPRWDTTWFHIVGVVPDAWAGLDCVLTVHLGYGGGTGFGAEGLVWIAGEPVQGISPNHREVAVARPARGGEAVDLYIEAAANPPAPSQDPGALLSPDPHGEPQLTLRRCHLSVVEPEVVALLREWQVVDELSRRSGENEAAHCLDALDRAADAIDASDVCGSAPAARAALRPILQRPSKQGSHRHLAVGNAHIDTAWLWPLRETRRKVARTFSTTARLLDAYPDFCFAASQPQQFAWLREDYPGLWSRLQEHAAAGRFEVVGSMWVEADCNLPSGESLVRQVVHGKRFFREEFGVDTRGLWLPDVFGYSAALPQILAQSGHDWFLTQKISWNEVNRFPHHTFWWQGIDGTRIFTHFPPADTYAGSFAVAELRRGARNSAQQDGRNHSMYLFGYGDGGGGPTAEMLERARVMADLDDVGRVELTTASDAMAQLRSETDDDEIPTWVGELYLEMHRGTYTTQGAVKQGNRELELALRDAELWSLVAHRMADQPLPLDALDAAWKTLLLHQFHDIIPGSGINWVYRDTAADYEALRFVVEEILDDSLGALAGRVTVGDEQQPVLVANTLPFARDEVVEVDGALHRLTAPPCGWAVEDLAAAASRHDAPVQAGPGFMDNGILRVEWDAQGLLRSLIHHPTAREAVAPGTAANLLQLMDDHPALWDAWDIDRSAFDTAVDLTQLDHLELIESNELRATLRLVRSFGASQIEQRIQLQRGSGRLEIHCSVDWHETHKLLKVAFPVDVHTSVARHEIQFGHVERSTHDNTSWDAAQFETCAHTWVDLSEHGFGVALLNDSKYGHDIRGNVIRLSLLRSPTWPDPQADRGKHRFAYALYPHAGSAPDGGVIAEAHAFNSPLRVTPIDPRTSAALSKRHSFLELSDPGVVVTALKAADDGDGGIVRLHEAFGGRRRVRVQLPGLSAVERVDLLEQPAGSGEPLALGPKGIALDLRPFELVTLRFWQS